MAKEGEAHEFSCEESTTARNRYLRSLNIWIWKSREKSRLVLHTQESSIYVVFKARVMSKMV